ncbi:MAG: hypothetical protein IT384_30900 [Deltaproteobacteria bacterium]|nr:hypothetical protein [Deltaproteobacteria bacterium]
MQKLPIRLLACSALLAACSEETGGITAELRIVDDAAGKRRSELGAAPGKTRSALGATPGQRRSALGAAPGKTRSALGAAAVPEEIGRLEITALDVTGSTLARTVLADAPVEGEERLVPAGGTWRLSDVPAGRDRAVRGRAFLRALPGSPLDGSLAFAGQIGGIEVIAGQTADAGVLELFLIPGVRIPRLDFDPPSPPGPIQVAPDPRGEALIVTYARPIEPDVAGYLIAVTSSLTANPPVSRGPIALSPGDTLAPGVVVAARVPSPSGGATTVGGLSNGQTYRVLVYAYDADLEDRALNFSPAAGALGVPADRQAPGLVEDLRVVAVDSTSAEIRFVGTGEDGASGRPASYDLRAARDATALEGAGFELLPAISPPPLVDAGVATSVRRTFSELGQDATEDFYIGLRARDAAGNVGMVAVARYTVNATTTPPLVVRFSPELGIAGSALGIEGRLFGAATGTVTLTAATATATHVQSLRVRSWSSERISVDLPLEAHSGEIRVIRAEGTPSAPAFLAVFLSVAAQIEAAEIPFFVVSAPLAPTASAIWRERDVGATYEEAIERVFGTTGERAPFAPFSTPRAPQAVAGTYSAGHDRFLFVVSTSNPSVLSASLMSTSTRTPLARRLPSIVAAGNADGLGVQILTSTPAANELPVLLALSSGGVVRTASTPDLLTRPFFPFTTVTATTEIADHVALLRRIDPTDPTQSEVRIAYRDGGPANGRLVVQGSRGDGGGPYTPLATQGPPVGERHFLLDVPGLGFVVIYEERLSGGGIEVRLLPLDRFGSGAGFAPFNAAAPNRRLEDAGLVHRGAQIWIALAITEGTQLRYAEIDPALLDGDGRAAVPIAALDNFVGGAVAARLGCRQVATFDCPLIWNGPAGPTQIFLRR